MVSSSVIVPRRQPSYSEARDASVHEALVVTALALPVLRDLAKVWISLEDRAEGSFFTTWTWVGTWLETLEIRNDTCAALRLVQARRGDRIVGLCLFGAVPRSWRTAAHTPLVLNQSGQRQIDAIYVEYNDVLVADEDSDTVRRACLQPLLALPGRPRLRIQAAAEPLTAALADSDIPHRAFRQERCDVIDLRAAELMNGALSVPSRNARGQIARALRRAEANGPLRLRRAETIGEAEQDLADLKAFHRTAWQSRKGHPGAFANPFVTDFVSRLVRAGHGNGSVDLLRVTAGSQTIGILLNFVHRGEVYAYQSGLNYSDDNRDKPGLVCHALAAAHYKGRDCRAYHFMAGAARYKTSLSNAQETLTWIECYRNDALTRAEHAAEAFWRRLRGPRAVCR